jgi:hypothetical protein
MTLTGLFRAARRRHPASEDPFSRAVRLCGEYLATPTGASTPAGAGTASGEGTAARDRLVAAIGVLTVAHTTAAAEGADGGTQVFDALLRAGHQALDADRPAESRLALGLAEAATAARDRSKGAWRLRGLALDALGRYEGAVEAYRRHLALQDNPRAGQEIAHRVGTLLELGGCLDEAAGLFPGDDSTGVRPRDDGSGSDGGSDTRHRGEPKFGDDGRFGSDGRFGGEQASTAFGAYVALRIGERGAGDPAVRRLVELYSRYRRLSAQDRMVDPLLGGTEPIGVGAFRNLIAGRTVCVVSDAAAGAGQPGIDAYDLVIRCDGLPGTDPERTDPERTGAGRTDVHAVTVRGASPWLGPGWQQRAGTRLVFGERLPEWRQALRRRLVPGAQDRVGDGSLRRPLRDPALLGENGWGEGTSTGFTVVRLLDFLDVSPRIDLIGFGLPGRLRPKEKEWVMTHSTRTDDGVTRMSLR